MPKKFPWKQNFLKVPATIMKKLQKLDDDFVKIAATKNISKDDIKDGAYDHVGLFWGDGEVITGEPVVPSAEIGKWSFRNARGWDRVREDWPKVTKTWTFEAPNFGDGARNGYSTRYRTQEVKQHQIFEPQGMNIVARVLKDNGGDKILINFELSPVLSRSMPEFELMLLWAINVMQENTGVADLYASDVSAEDYLKTITLDWQIFPSGSADELIARLEKNAGNGKNVEFAEEIRDRVSFFEVFEPAAYIRGQGGFGSYFGAQFTEDLVVFENLRYGHAVYLLYEDWEQVPRRSRLDLLRDIDANFDRIIHNNGWQTRLREMLQLKLRERGLSTRAAMRGPIRRRR